MSIFVFYHGQRQRDIVLDLPSNEGSGKPAQKVKMKIKTPKLCQHEHLKETFAHM